MEICARNEIFKNQKTNAIEKKNLLSGKLFSLQKHLNVVDSRSTKEEIHEKLKFESFLVDHMIESRTEANVGDGLVDTNLLYAESSPPFHTL